MKKTAKAKDKPLFVQRLLARRQRMRRLQTTNGTQPKTSGLDTARLSIMVRKEMERLDGNGCYRRLTACGIVARRTGYAVSTVERCFINSIPMARI